MRVCAVRATAWQTLPFAILACSAAPRTRAAPPIRSQGEDRDDEEPELRPEQLEVHVRDSVESARREAEVGCERKD